MDKRARLVFLAVVLGVGSTAAAVDTYIDPGAISATASSVNYQLQAIYSCNENGLSGDVHTNEIGGEPPAAGQGTMWLANAIAGEWIQYGFDKTYELHNMWIWNYNQITPVGADRTTRGIRECTIEYSVDGSSWNRVGGVQRFAKADGSDNYAHNAEIDFGGVEARYVRISVTSAHGGKQAGLSEVRFYADDVVGPVDNAEDVEPNVKLIWKRGADSYDVYFGIDEAGVVNATTASAQYQGRQETNSFNPGLSLEPPRNLDFETTYYWRIDEIDSSDPDNPVKGPVWSFTVRPWRPAASGYVYLPCDVGDCASPESRIQPGWINIPHCGEYTDIGGTNVDVSIVAGIELDPVPGQGGNCDCRGYFSEFDVLDGVCPVGLCPASGPLGDVEQDFLFANDAPSGRRDMIVVFHDLAVGYPYMLTSYHSRLDLGAGGNLIAEITGATNVHSSGQITQTHAIMDNPPVTTFTPTVSDVTIKFVSPGGAFVFLNGFILDGGPNDMAFESSTSEGFETAGQAAVNVRMAYPSDTVVTVDYAVTGGTATAGEDFVLDPGTLTFEPGETTKEILLSIVDDGLDEPDETIIITLSNLKGYDVVISSKFEHTYAILDPKPFVYFDVNSSMATEDEVVLPVLVMLTEGWHEEVTVDYTVTGGTATAGADYVLNAGTLVFDPNQKSGTIDIDLVNDGVTEDSETIVVTLSNPTNSKLAEPTEHTATIRDPWPTQYDEIFRVDLGCPGNAASFKQGWIPWSVHQGCDGEPHDGRWINDIIGTGINAYVGTHGGSGGNMFTRAGDPIANSAYTSLAGRGHPGGSIRIRLSGLAPRAYSLQTYHSWEGLSNIRSAVPEGEGVIEIQIAVTVPVRDTIADEELAPAEVRFHTDGTGTVNVIYEASPTSKACINAFVLSASLKEPAGCACPGDLNADDQLDLDDLQALAGILLDAGSPFIAAVPPAPICADINGDGQADLDDLQAVAGILLEAGSPFIATCD